jgi:hypothetical protein
MKIRLALAAAGTIAGMAAFPVAASASAPYLHTPRTSHAAAFDGPTFIAYTTLSDRPDSGGAGTWALDRMTRQLSITEVSGGDGIYTFTATVSDSAGSFVAIDGAPTPNQGAPHTGDLISGTPTGSFTGSASYIFTASSLPTAVHNLGLPASEPGPAGDFAETTSGWYEQAFPDGTVFGGAGIGDWGWTYHTSAFPSQSWADTSANAGGQLPADGNISS